MPTEVQIAALDGFMRPTEQATYTRPTEDDLDFLDYMRRDPDVRGDAPGGPIGGDQRGPLLRDIRAGRLLAWWVIRNFEGDRIGLCAFQVDRQYCDKLIQISSQFRRSGFGRDALRSMDTAWFNVCPEEPSFASTLERNLAARELLRGEGYVEVQAGFVDGLGQPGVLYRKPPPQNR